jgi:hypothetical protein
MVRDRFGLMFLYLPHVETHVEYEAKIERLLTETDAGLVNLRLWAT